MKIKHLGLFETSTSIGLTDSDFDMIVKQCRPFLLDNIDHMMTGLVLYRGVVKSDLKKTKALVQTIDINTNRKPRDSTKLLHHVSDIVMSELYGGIKWRSSSLFATTDVNEASEYGSVYMVLPVDDYELLYSRNVKDLININTFSSCIENCFRWLQKPALIDDPVFIKTGDLIQSAFQNVLDTVHHFLKQSGLDKKYGYIARLDVGGYNSLSKIEWLWIARIIDRAYSFPFFEDDDIDNIDASFDTTQIHRLANNIMIGNKHDSHIDPESIDQNLARLIEMELKREFNSTEMKKKIAELYIHMIKRSIKETYVMSKEYDQSADEDESREVMIYSKSNKAVIIKMSIMSNSSLYGGLAKMIAQELKNRLDK